MNIDEKVLIYDGIGECIIEKKFYSKKNNVYLVRTSSGRYVIKEYMENSSAEREEGIYKILISNGVPVPNLVYWFRDYIIMEYIEGRTLLDELCAAEEGLNSIDALLSNFTIWLKRFYSVTRDAYGFQMIMGDVNLRNFIVKDEFYGIDFEEFHRGNIEEDAGRICAFLISYVPAFTEWKIRMAGKLLSLLSESLCLNSCYIKNEFKDELRRIEKRRNIHAPAGIIDEVFK